MSLFETVTGLGTVALMISYLPALYGAYSRREARLLTLDDPDGRRLTPVRVISLNCASGDLDLLYRFFGEWEMWTARCWELMPRNRCLPTQKNFLYELRRE